MYEKRGLAILAVQVESLKYRITTMHGVKRRTGGWSGEEAAERKRKSELYTKVSAVAFKQV
jgi:hypothetical protein